MICNTRVLGSDQIARNAYVVIPTIPQYHTKKLVLYMDAEGFYFKIRLFPFHENAYSVSWTIFKAFSIFMLDCASDG